MKKYLATIHTRSDRHKQGFALAVAGGTTLLIFGIWFLVRTEAPATVAQSDTAPQLGSTQEVGPFESLAASVGDAWDAIGESFEEVTQSLKGVDLESGYTEMKEDTLDTYGR